MKSRKIMFGAVCLAMICMTACGGDIDANQSEFLDEEVTEQMTTVVPEIKTEKSTKIKTNDTISKSDSVESYYCMGKHDTCNNKTYDPYDFYCSSCDPDNDNIEG
ncbi:MAG: hypothetical protein K2H29_05140 [Oscillospiraceae bacterium]|nr:hypothetical protein [Oscillospiraceae bacterium]MDE5884447.1 hypothetical protein [Oscillospiraceae bacterium]